MKLKKYFIFLLLLSSNFAVFAEQSQLTSMARNKLPLASDNKNSPEDAEVEAPDPVGMKLVASNFSLQGLRPTNKTPTANLQLTSSVLTNSDLTDAGVGTSAATSNVFFNGASLSALPKITENTRISANINGGFIRYNGKGENDFDTLNANLGVFQQIGEKMSGELGWRYSQYYVSGDKVTFNQKDLQEQGVRLALNRLDKLPKDFFISSNYELQANFSGPVDRSRVSHYFTEGLGYNFTNSLQAMLFYRLKHDDFTHRSTNDSATRHEFQAQLSYQAFQYINLAATVSYLFGDTIDLLRDPLLSTGLANNAQNTLSNLSFGFRINANFPILD